MIDTLNMYIMLTGFEEDMRLGNTIFYHPQNQPVNIMVMYPFSMTLNMLYLTQVPGCEIKGGTSMLSSCPLLQHACLCALHEYK